MSVACMSWVFAHSTAAGADRLLLLAIADHAGDDGGDAWPSVPTLAGKTGTSVRSVQRGISRLEAGGHLVVERGAGRRGTNLYRVVMGRQDVTGDDLAPVTKPGHQGGDTQASPERPVRPSSPQPPALRSEGTNPRAVAAAAARDGRARVAAVARAERMRTAAAIAACGRCDARGYLPAGRVCDHDPDGPDRAARGMQLVRAEMARRARPSAVTVRHTGRGNHQPALSKVVGSPRPVTVRSEERRTRP